MANAEFKLKASPESIAHMELCKEQAVKLGESYMMLSSTFERARQDLEVFGNRLKTLEIQMKAE